MSRLCGARMLKAVYKAAKEGFQRLSHPPQTEGRYLRVNGLSLPQTLLIIYPFRPQVHVIGAACTSFALLGWQRLAVVHAVPSSDLPISQTNQSAPIPCSMTATGHHKISIIACKCGGLITARACPRPSHMCQAETTRLCRRHGGGRRALRWHREDLYSQFHLVHVLFVRCGSFRRRGEPSTPFFESVPCIRLLLSFTASSDAL